MSDITYQFKIIIAGDGGVGKTTLLRRYVDGTFNVNTNMTIGLEFHQKTIVIDGKYTFELLLWDFSGQEHFRFLLDKFVEGASGALLMFDLTRINTMLELDEWVDIIERQEPDIPVILVGGKTDLLVENFYSDEDKALEYIDRYDFKQFLKVSSKTGENVDEIFELVVREIFKSKS